MLIYKDGKEYEASQEEIEMIEKEINSNIVITNSERLRALENAIADIAVMMVGGVSNDWIH